MKGQAVLFSKKSDEYETPDKLFAEWDDKFHFDVDAAATKKNAKCAKFWTAEDDALQQDWTGLTVWCNPPYSRCAEFVQKAYDTMLEDPTSCVVMLLPARTDTKWFHRYIYLRELIYFLKGRVKFKGGQHSAPFPSMIVVFE